MRPLTAARLLLGSVGLLFTRRVLPLWGADPRSERVVGVARVLATRHLVQGAVLAVLPSRRTDIASAAVDLLHGLTMVALAAVSPSYRRPAATSASVALCFAALTGICLQRDGRRADVEPEAGRVLPFRTPPSPPADRSREAEAPSGDDEPSLEVLEVEAHEYAADLTHPHEGRMAAATDAPMLWPSRAGAMVLLLRVRGGRSITASGIARPRRPGARRRVAPS